MYARQRLAWFTLRVQEVSMVSYNFSFSSIYFNICASSIACGVDTANRINYKCDDHRRSWIEEFADHVPLYICNIEHVWRQNSEHVISS